MSPPRGKAGTRGRKQIEAENGATLRFYGIVVLAAAALHAVLGLVYSYESSSSSWTWWALLALSTAVNALSLYGMARLAEPTRCHESGAVLLEGADLNATTAGDDDHDEVLGVAVHLKDVILLTAVLQVASAVCCRHVWWLWLLAPARGVHLLWRAWKAVEDG